MEFLLSEKVVIQFTQADFVPAVPTRGPGAFISEFFSSWKRVSLRLSGFTFQNIAVLMDRSNIVLIEFSRSVTHVNWFYFGLLRVLR